jgi:hypothetical protein
MKQLFAALFLAIALATLSGFSGCSGTPSSATTPVLDNAAAQRAVYDAEGRYKIALIAADTYAHLPLCDKAAPPCATLTVVRQIQAAQPAARAAIDAAESAVRTPGFGADIVQSSVTAATAALGAFVAITNTAK